MPIDKCSGFIGIRKPNGEPFPWLTRIGGIGTVYDQYGKRRHVYGYAIDSYKVEKGGRNLADRAPAIIYSQLL